MAENVLLEFDGKSGYGLLLRRLARGREYVVAYGYDPSEGDWKQGHYHESIESAVVDYNRCIGGAPIEIAPDGCFCTIRWCDEDILSYLSDRLGEEYATSGNVERCKDMMRGGKTLRDRSIEEGWEIIDACVERSSLVAMPQEGLSGEEQ